MDVGTFENQWFALHVRSRREHMCAQILRSKGYEEFLPLAMPGVSGSLRRVSTQRQPLFPGYVFCRLSANVCGPIVTTPGVIRILGFGGVPSPISEEQIKNIQHLVDYDHPTYRWPYISVGQRIRITSGALRGVTGVLLRTKNVHRLIVSIDLLLRSVAVEVDTACVTTADLVTNASVNEINSNACGQGAPEKPPFRIPLSAEVWQRTTGHETRALSRDACLETARLVETGVEQPCTHAISGKVCGY